MSPRSRSRSITSRRSYSRSPNRRSDRRSYRSYKLSNSRKPPSPPPLTNRKKSGRYSSDSRSLSRSISPSYRKHHSDRDRRRYNRTRSRTRSRSTSSSLNIRNQRDKPLPSRCIGVFGLSVYTTQVQVREIFEKFGPIERIQFVIDAQTGRSRGFCFVYYENIDDATAACDNCCGMEVDGRRIRVAYSITQRPHTPTPGVYKGGPARSFRESSRSRRPKRNHSPVSHSKAHRYGYDRSRSRSYSSRRHRY